MAQSRQQVLTICFEQHPTPSQNQVDRTYGNQISQSWALVCQEMRDDKPRVVKNSSVEVR